MDISYNAFISYRHHSVDSRVAKEIHRCLEHYHIPREIRSRVQPIRKLFRDKEELPITNNLSDIIQNALDHSQFLIVICSPRTRDSQWVEREIQYFLSGHDRDHVLTVLAEGMPEESIPESLLYEKRVDPVTGGSIRTALEPLSCDWRLPHRRAHQEELPRLAAALMGCSYDDLRQREKHYRAIRKTAAGSTVLALMLGFSGVVLHSNHRLQQANQKIQANLDQALINQSVYLASASGEAMEFGDRDTAIALALEALPEYPGERPYVPEAERALARALQIYQVSPEMTARLLNADTEIKSFQIDPDRAILYTIDSRNTVTVWDAQTQEQISFFSLESSNVSDDWLITPEGNCLFELDNRLLQCRSSTGEILWQEHDFHEWAYLTDRNLVVTMSYEDLYRSTHQIRLLDPKTGKAVSDPVLIESDSPLFGENTVPFFAKTCMDSSNGILLYSTDFKGYALGLLDPDTGVCRHLLNCSRPQCFNFMACGDILVMTQGPESPVCYRFGTSDTYSLFSHTVTRISPEGRTIWSASFPSNLWLKSSGLQEIPDQGQIYGISNDSLVFLDSETGKVTSLTHLYGMALYAEWNKDHLSVINSFGMWIDAYPEEMQFYGRTRFVDDLVQAQDLHNYIYVLPNHSDHLLCYERSPHSLWQTSDSFPTLTQEWKADGHYLCTISEQNILSVFDLYSGRKILSSDIARDAGQNDSPYPRILGFQGNRLWVWLSHSDQFICYDLDNGEIHPYAIPFERDGFHKDLVFTAKNRICQTYWYGGLSKTALRVLDITDNSVTDIPLGSMDGFTTELLTCSDSIALLWYSKDGLLLEVDLNTHSAAVVQRELFTRPAVMLLDERTYGVGTEGELTIYGPGASVLRELDVPGCVPLSCCLRGEELIVLCDNSRILIYNSKNELASAQDPEFTSEFSEHLVQLLSQSAPLQQPIIWQFLPDEDRLLLSSGGFCILIDTNQWKPLASTDSLLVYDPEIDSFLLCENNLFSSGSRLAWIPRYSTKDLIRYAQEVLGPFHLSPQQKQFYGLTE